MIKDLALGIRLAVGGGRISGSVLLRLAMTTIGIALVVAVLLPAASIGHMLDERTAREAMAAPLTEPRQGIDPLYQHVSYLQVHGKQIHGEWLAASGPTSPVPPGLTRIPAPGEVVVSPEVRDMLNSADGPALRARLPGPVTGVLGKPGLTDANDLRVYLGAPPDQLREDTGATKVYGFGTTSTRSGLTAGMVLLLVPAAAALLLPLLIFVTTASRMGAAQRDRRLAALRLIGVDGGRIRRIAAAESLLGACVGLLMGGGLFLVLRSFIGKLELFGIRLFGEDVVPPWPMAMLIVLLVPGLAVGAAIFGLRRTIVEPLGVVRQGKPLRRRMWWRWVITALGAVLILSTLFAEQKTNDAWVMTALVTGSTLLLIGVAVVLPWAVERLVRGIKGGPPSWQFAIRRLQLDSGTASRVVSGLVVVLAGTILIQVMLASVSAEQRREATAAPKSEVPVQVRTDSEHLSEARRLVGGASGVTEVHELRTGYLETADERTPRPTISVETGDCAALATRANLPSCADGDVFFVDPPPNDQAPFRGGQMPTGLVRFISYDRASGKQQVGPQWTVPKSVRHVPADGSARFIDSGLLITPAALGNAVPPYQSGSLYVGGSGSADELSDRVASAVSRLAWYADVDTTDQYDRLEHESDQTIARVRGALLAASLAVLSVAALSLLMLSVEQITERRRPLAALSAAGIPLSVLARGSLWQTAIPVAVGVVLAIATGLGLTAPILRLADMPMTLDALTIGGLAGAAVLAVLVVTTLTLPLLRQVTRLDSLRSE